MTELAMLAEWLTDSECVTHKVTIRPASSLAQDRESSPVKDQRSTTVLRRVHGFSACRHVSRGQHRQTTSMT